MGEEWQGQELEHTVLRAYERMLREYLFEHGIAVDLSRLNSRKMIEDEECDDTLVSRMPDWEEERQNVRVEVLRVAKCEDS